MKLMRDIQPAFAAFAVIAMLMHAGFWLACAMQAPPGTSRSETISFVVPICSPSGMRSELVAMSVAGEEPTDGSMLQDCPSCALVCGTDLSPTAGHLVSPVSAFEARLPSIIESTTRSEVARMSSLFARAPPFIV